MKYRKLGGGGLRVSEVALGSWLTFGHDVDQDATNACVKEAFDVGINFFDTADVYALGACEVALGKALTPYRRQDYVLASKCYFPMGEGPNERGLSRKHIVESLQASLDRLQTPYLDLYQCHRFDPEVSTREVVRTMDDLIRRGLIFYWGVSQWPAEKIVEAVKISLAIGAEPPISNQPPYNLLERDIEEVVIPEAARNGVGQIVYSPLAQGLFSGKYRGGKVPDDSRAKRERSNEFIKKRMTPENMKMVDDFCDLADAAGIPAAPMALAWCLRQPAVASVIIGATRPEQVRENALAADVVLDPVTLDALDRLRP